MLMAASRSLAKNTAFMEQNRCRARKAATGMLSCCLVMRAQGLQYHFVLALWPSTTHCRALASSTPGAPRAATVFPARSAEDYYCVLAKLLPQ